MKPVRQTFDDFKAGAYFEALDGLRAISILLVLLHHVPRFSGPQFLNTLQENGRYGVAFFFVISGFLIGTLLLREQEKNGKIDLWKFYGRRSLRLLPLYYAALLLQAVIVFGLKQYTPENQALFAEKLPAYLFYYSNWLATATQGPFFQAWSLAVEEQFYLAFGLLLFYTRNRTVIVATLAALLVKFFVYETYGAVDAGSTFWRVVFSYREPILFGVLAAFALNRRRVFELFQRGLDSALAITLLSLATAGWLCMHLMRHESFWDAQLLYLLMTMTVIGLAIRPATAVLDNRLMTHIGKISYGIYLLHMFVIVAVRKMPGGGSPAICFFFSTLVVIIVASLVYQYFERPIIVFYKRKFSPYNTTAAFPATQEGIPAVSAPPVEEPGRVPV
ncbi:MAG TPA: acyltransferase [Candidatus Acidoferrales bacterium]|jgi:peptidoglycan/LPS O-acetylase OafA/YrhL|nr:acyltransferase [Candidatus Acidoferrales bacterium]